MGFRPTGRVFVEHEYEESGGLGCGLWIGGFVALALFLSFIFGLKISITLIMSLFFTVPAFIYYHLTKK